LAIGAGAMQSRQTAKLDVDKLVFCCVKACCHAE
jgi:hypothetical protein